MPPIPRKRLAIREGKGSRPCTVQGVLPLPEEFADYIRGRHRRLRITRSEAPVEPPQPAGLGWPPDALSYGIPARPVADLTPA